VASDVMPASTPTAVSVGACCSTEVSTRIDTNHRSAASRETVTVEGSAPSGRGRDHTMFSGSRIFASVSCPSRNLKPDLVYSADWRVVLRDLKRVYYARLSKNDVTAP